MHVDVYKTHKITANECLFSLLDTYIPTLQEKSILVVTSKIVSLCEGSFVKKESVSSKEALIQSHADAFLDYPLDSTSSHAVQLTIKNNILIPSAGIDESNGNGLYILYPKNIQQSALTIWQYIRKRDSLQQLGILISDSHTTPMRRGVLGLGLGWCGFNPVYNYIGKPDCFGSLLRMTKVNNLDALAASAVFCMGEGNEQTPFAVITGAPKIIYSPIPPTAEEMKEVTISLQEDLYAPLLKNAPWIFNK